MLKMADTATGPSAKKQHPVKVLPEATKVDSQPLSRRDATKLPSSEARAQTSTSGSASLRGKPKASSFQITSVTLGTRTSADNGEDSADDLDESHSHTDDNSRVTDHGNETPSFSEDTSFSKEDVFYSSNALGTAPVIPTSSQYGLAIVSPELNGTATLTDVHVSLTDAGINIVGNAKQNCDVDIKDGHQRNERFKVVKIESTEPFKRGRWMCMDYLDHTTLQQANAASDGAIDTDDSVAKVNNILPGQTAPAVFYNSSVATVTATEALPEVTTAAAVATTIANTYTAQSMPSHQLQEAIATAAKRPPKVSTRHHTPGQTQPVQVTPVQGRRSIQEYTQGATLPAHLLNFRDTAGLEASLASLSSGHPVEQHHSSTSPKAHRTDTVTGAAVAPETPSSQHHPVAVEVERVKEQLNVTTDETPPCDRVSAETVDSNCVSTSSGVNSPTVSVMSQPEMTPDAITTEVDPSSQEQHLSGAASANPDENPQNDDSENASGTSAVAIDNKIEQAMDLVKSHLMFAVREEVEVLKEKIAELMDRINQLEVENTILKANATQETLSQLSATLASGKVPASNTGNGSVS